MNFVKELMQDNKDQAADDDLDEIQAVVEADNGDDHVIKLFTMTTKIPDTEMILDTKKILKF